jgi:hypothetical protein
MSRDGDETIGAGHRDLRPVPDRPDRSRIVVDGESDSRRDAELQVDEPAHHATSNRRDGGGPLSPSKRHTVRSLYRMEPVIAGPASQP